MGRSGITYDQVAAAADALTGEGGTVSIKALREKLGGTGSPNTIHKHMTLWQANRPKEAAPAVELPPTIAAALQGWVLQAATVARADAEARLVQAQAESVELARAGEMLELERDELLAQMSRLTTERDQAAATAMERGAEIDRLGAEVERERALAGAAQIEAAQAKLKVDAQAHQLSDLKEANARLSSALEAERGARVAADKDAAVALAQRDAARNALGGEEERGRALQAQLDKAQQELEAARTAAIDNARLKAELAAAQNSLARMENPGAKPLGQRKG